VHKLNCLRTNASTYGAVQRLVKFPDPAYPTLAGAGARSGLEGVWTNSYEPEQHLSFNPPATEPVCWSLMGHASGWCTAFFGSPVIAIEPLCVGKGDAHCEWLIQPLAAWGDKDRPYLTAYQPFYNRT
jgi:hypothetical protein